MATKDIKRGNPAARGAAKPVAQFEATKPVPAILAHPEDEPTSPEETLAAALAAVPVTPHHVEADPPIIEAVEPAPTTITAAAPVADSTQKDNIMATNFAAPQMTNDVADKAKAAMEKGGKFVAEIGEFGKGNVEALVESTRIAAKGIEAMGQDAAEYGRQSFEGLTATLKSLASIKSPTEFFKLQNDYVRSSFDAAVAQGSKNTEALMKLAGDTVQPISSRFAVAVEKVKAAA